MFQTYILKSQKNHRYYVGSCEHLAVRLQKHNSGEVRSTKNYIPWKIVYDRKFENRSGAVQHEREIKGWKSRTAIEKLIKTFQNSKEIEDSR